MRRNSYKNKEQLSARQVTAIFSDKTRSQPQIAEQYGVSQSMVSLIRSGQRWAGLTKNLPLYRRIGLPPHTKRQKASDAATGKGYLLLSFTEANTNRCLPCQPQNSGADSAW